MSNRYVIVMRERSRPAEAAATEPRFRRARLREFLHYGDVSQNSLSQTHSAHHAAHHHHHEDDGEPLVEEVEEMVDEAGRRVYVTTDGKIMVRDFL